MMTEDSPRNRSWGGVPKWLQVAAFVGALAVAAGFAVRLGGASRMEPWLVLVSGMLAGRLLAELLAPVER